MNEINDIWYGFLEAGEKSSPVLIDPKLDTGNSKTVYMYNLNSQRIIEYKREIAEPKLRILNEQEAALMKALKQGYESIRKEFTPRNSIVISAAAAAAVSAKPKNRKRADIEEDDSLVEFDMDDSDIDLDDDLDEDPDSDEE
ncbi:hypothetical protein [Kaarinaea lacus]